MAMKIVIVVACVVAVAIADKLPIHAPQYPPPYHPAPVDYPDVPPKYEYKYGVTDHYRGLNYEASESRDGYNTEGQYVVDLPDGRKQTFSYVDNGNGLLADVKYEGEAKHPVSYPSHPPPPPYA
ncbi:pro-resilin-like [Oratosquilla oratoria]|uniref:pro-resilin-like n=1 Tax=Oratosquilla oratoria TaxID=337810 RepID=UPI003F7722FE